MFYRSVASAPGKFAIRQISQLYGVSSRAVTYKRFFHGSFIYSGVRPYLLADIGEGKV